MQRVMFFIILLIVLLLVWQALFMVKEYENVLVVRFGKPLPEQFVPGLHWKIPVIDKVFRYDGRLQSLTMIPLEIPTSDNQIITLKSVAFWQVNDPAALWRGLGSQAAAARRLNDLLESALRDEFARYPLVEIVRPQKQTIEQKTWRSVQGLASEETRRSWKNKALGQGEQLEARVMTRVREQLQASDLGIDLLDLAILKIDHKGSIE